MEQHFVGREQQVIERRTIARGDGLQAIGQFAWQQRGDQVAAPRLRRRAWSIRRQIQLRHAGQLVFPECELLGDLGTFQEVLLPHAVVAILDRRQFQRAFLALVIGLIDLRQLLGQHGHRRAVEHRVMDRDVEDVGGRGQLHQLRAEDRAGRQMERPLRLDAAEPVRFRLAVAFRQG